MSIQKQITLIDERIEELTRQYKKTKKSSILKVISELTKRKIILEN